MACLSSKRVCARAVQEKLMCQFLSKRNNFHRQSQNHSRYLAAPGLRITNDRRTFSTSPFFRSLNDSASGSSGSSSSGGGINQVRIDTITGRPAVAKWFFFARSACCVRVTYFWQSKPYETVFGYFLQHPLVAVQSVGRSWL